MQLPPHLPEYQRIVVAARRQQAVVRGPLRTHTQCTGHGSGGQRSSGQTENDPQQGPCPAARAWGQTGQIKGTVRPTRTPAVADGSAAKCTPVSTGSYPWLCLLFGATLNRTSWSSTSCVCLAHLEAAHLRPVARQPIHKVVGQPHVPQQDGLVPAATGQHVAAPRLSSRHSETQRQMHTQCYTGPHYVRIPASSTKLRRQYQDTHAHSLGCACSARGKEVLTAGPRAPQPLPCQNLLGLAQAEHYRAPHLRAHSLPVPCHGPCALQLADVPDLQGHTHARYTQILRAHELTRQKTRTCSSALKLNCNTGGRIQTACF